MNKAHWQKKGGYRWTRRWTWLLMAAGKSQWTTGVLEGGHPVHTPWRRVIELARVICVAITFDKNTFQIRKSTISN